MDSSQDSHLALVTLLSGEPVGVIVGADAEALEGQGQAFVEEQGCNAYFALCDVEQPTALHRGGVDVQALARGAVRFIEDSFFDYAREARHTPGLGMTCPECSDGTSIGEDRCTQCGTRFPGGLRNQAVFDDAVACVSRAIGEALCRAHCPRLVTIENHRDFEVAVGGQPLAQIRVWPRRCVYTARRTPRNRAVELLAYRPGGGFDTQTVRLGQATRYLERLGIGPGLLLERARERGWEV